MTQIVNVHIGLAAWSSATYVLGDRRSNGSNAYQCITAGASTAAPTGTGSSINNGGAAVWKYLSSIDRPNGDLRFSTSPVIPATLTQPVLVYIWNDGLISPAAGVQAIWLAGHTTTLTNTITVMPAPGDGFDATYLATPSTALAFNAANGVAIQCPASSTGSTNYIDIDDNNVIVRGLQIQDPNSASLSSLIGGAGANITVQKCIFDGFSQNSGAVLVQLEGGGLSFTNNLVIGRNTTLGGPIVQVGSITGVVVVNNTFVHLTNVFGQTVLDGASNPTSGSNIARNNIFINYTAPYQSAVTTCWLTDHSFYTAASFLSTSNGTDAGGSVYGITTAATFVAFSTDFNLKTGAAPLDAAVTDVTDIPTTDDMFGRSRPQGSAWDGGSAELAAAAYVATLSDTVATSAGPSTMFAASYSDTTATSDSLIPVSGVLGFTTSLTNTATTSDLAQSVTGFSKFSSDLVVTLDSFTSPTFTTVLPTELASSHDAYAALAGAFATVLSDTVVTNDLAHSFSANAFTDTAVASDILTSISSNLLNLVTTATTSDGLNSAPVVFVSVLTDTIVTSSIFTFSNALPLTDSAVTGENLTSQIAVSQQLLFDSLTTSSAFTFSGGSAGVSPWTADWSTAFGAGISTGASLALADTVSTSDSVVLRGYGILRNDTLTAGDSLVANFTASFGANPWTTDFNISFGFGTPGFSYADSLATSETLLGSVTTSIGTTASLNDSAATTDNLKFSGISVAYGDASLTGDNLITARIAVAVSYSDSLASSETWLPTAISGSTITVLSDSLVTSDTRTTSQTNAAWADTAATSEILLPSAAVSGGTVTLLTDSLLTSDSQTTSHVNGVWADVVAINETLISNTTANGGTVTALNDSLSTGGSPATSQVNGTWADLVAISEMLIPSAAVSGSTITTLNDSLTINDNQTATQINGAWTDIVATSEALLPSTTIGGITTTTLNDGVVTSDGITATAVNGTRADTLIISETLISVYGTYVTVSDTVTTSEILLIPATSQILADALTTSDVFNAYLDVIGDTLTGSESYVVTATVFSGTIVDTIIIADLYVSLTLIDSAATGDGLTEQLTSLQNFIDALSSSDILLSNYGYQTSLFDAVTIGDDDTLQNFGYSFITNDAISSIDDWSTGGVAAPLVVIATVVPTGGAVLLQFPSYFPVLPTAGQLTINRSVSGSGIWTTVYQGPPVGAFIDVGDGLPAPLDATTSYLWQVFDDNGSAVAGPLIPVASFLGTPDQLSQILIRLLQGAINGMRLPPGIQPTQVTTRMPQNGWQAMPFIVVNLDLIQQTEVAIGEDVINPTPDNNWTLFANAKRVWRVTVMSQDVEERDFYRDFLLAVFRVLKATAFGPLGINVTHSFQAASYASAQEYEGVAPGFYAADLMLELDGIFPVAVLTNYPVITQIVPQGTYLPFDFTIALTPSAN